MDVKVLIKRNTDNAPSSALPSSGKAPSSGQNPASDHFYLAKVPNSGQFPVVDKKSGIYTDLKVEKVVIVIV